MGVCLLYTVSRMNLAGQCTSWRDEGDYMPCEAFLTQTQRRAQFSPSISASTGSHSAWWRQNTAERGRRRGRLVARSCWDTEVRRRPKHAQSSRKDKFEPIQKPVEEGREQSVGVGRDRVWNLGRSRRMRETGRCHERGKQVVGKST